MVTAGILLSYAVLSFNSGSPNSSSDNLIIFICCYHLENVLLTTGGNALSQVLDIKISMILI